MRRIPIVLLLVAIGLTSNAQVFNPVKWSSNVSDFRLSVKIMDAGNGFNNIVNSVLGMSLPCDVSINDYDSLNVSMIEVEIKFHSVPDKFIRKVQQELLGYYCVMNLRITRL